MTRRKKSEKVAYVSELGMRVFNASELARYDKVVIDATPGGISEDVIARQVAKVLGEDAVVYAFAEPQDSLGGMEYTGLAGAAGEGEGNVSDGNSGEDGREAEGS